MTVKAKLQSMAKATTDLRMSRDRKKKRKGRRTKGSDDFYFRKEQR